MPIPNQWTDRPTPQILKDLKTKLRVLREEHRQEMFKLEQAFRNGPDQEAQRAIVDATLEYYRGQSDIPAYVQDMRTFFGSN